MKWSAKKILGVLSFIVVVTIWTGGWFVPDFWVKLFQTIIVGTLAILIVIGGK